MENLIITGGSHIMLAVFFKKPAVFYFVSHLFFYSKSYLIILGVQISFRRFKEGVAARGFR